MTVWDYDASPLTASDVLAALADLRCSADPPWLDRRRAELVVAQIEEDLRRRYLPPEPEPDIGPIEAV